MTRISPAWTEERIDQLKALVADRLSASQIAEQLGSGLSRNAVIGKAHRMGLCLRTPAECLAYPRVSLAKPAKLAKPPQRMMAKLRPRPARTPLWVSRREAAAKSEPKPLPRSPIPGTPLHLPLLALKAHHCRWPYGDGPFTFCGCTHIEGSPYCESHDADAYTGRAREWRAAA